MASLCRSGLISGSRNLISRSRTVTQKTLNLKPTTTTTSSPSMIPRVLSTTGSVDTMVPWSLLSQDNKMNNLSVSSIFQNPDNKFQQEKQESGTVVNVFTVSTTPSVFQPWQNQCSASGFAISRRKVLTNAHVVANHRFLEVRRNHGSQAKSHGNSKEVKNKSSEVKVKKPKVSKRKIKNKTKAKKVRKIEVTRRNRFCKPHLGRFKGISSRENRACFGRYALQTLEPACITSNQIEAGRRVMTPNLRDGGKLWIRIFPDKPVTSRPTEVRMGGGKGAPSHCVAAVKRGKILYEMSGVSESVARKAISVAASKLPIKTQFIICE